MEFVAPREPESSPEPEVTVTPGGRPDPSVLRHEAFVYSTPEEYVEGVAAFVSAGLAAEERVLVAVPAENGRMLQAHLGADADVEYADMRTLGRNPACITAAIREFLDDDPAVPARFVGEPIWPGRSVPELDEATIHESLINLAFARDAAAILCPYDASHLDPSVLLDAARTHPFVLDGGGRKPSPGYEDPATMCDAQCWPLTPAPASAITIEVGGFGLARARRLVSALADRAHLSDSRAGDLLLAVNEITTNALIHGSGEVTVSGWVEPDGVICEVRDEGHFGDLLAGRSRPEVDSEGKRGIWLVNQVCDLVQIRSGAEGTTVRLRVGRRGPFRLVSA